MASNSTHSRPRGALEGHVETEPGVTLDPTAAATDPETSTTQSLPPTTRARLYSVDRTILQARITALEQALEQKQRERTEIIDQYEQILNKRDQADDTVTIQLEDVSEQSRSLTARLRELLPGER